ncbi:MAG TPA: radical SAM protein [Proteobacteria bacterium]|nr:radical SAM protein [Pseudomonadota bacterium]
MEAAIITTYRCNCKCVMCNIWRSPTTPAEEFEPRILEKLPELDFANITGGEPFLREDIGEIVRILKTKARRIVISTNGYFTEKIISLVKESGDIGIRISIEGLPAANDELRGIKDGFDHGLRTLLELQRLGLKDIGFGITVSDRNARDMLELYQLARAMNVEFATAVIHNSYYFHKEDNVIREKEAVIECFEELIKELLRTNKLKNWFRAYFNYGLINYIRGNPRLLPCGAGENMFFLDPWGEIRPCNGLDEATPETSMGNLNEQSFEEVWNSARASLLKEKVRDCKKNCWMIGTASPAMKKHLAKPLNWVIKHKLKLLFRID